MLYICSVRVHKLFKYFFFSYYSPKINIQRHQNKVFSSLDVTLKYALKAAVKILLSNVKNLRTSVLENLKRYNYNSVYRYMDKCTTALFVLSNFTNAHSRLLITQH